MNTPARRNLMLMAAALMAAVLLGSCSPNKNTAATRRYQAFITRYNIHYNGDKHLRETLDEMERSYEDDYSQLLYMHPVEAKADEGAVQPTGNFDRSIEKAQKAIQVRSIKKKPKKKAGQGSNQAYKDWMRREEYNPFLHNSWLMLAEGQYYNGDFLGAASSFFYISRHFWWLPKTVTEAKLMQARCYIALGWNFEAEMILTRIKAEDLTAGDLNNLYNFAYADYYIHVDNYEQAVPYLEKAADAAKGAQKTRLRFLLGQVYARLGRRDDAYRAFGKAGSSSSTTYRTKFNARIKQSEVYTGTDIEPEVRALRRMTRYDRNKEYLDQVYYAIGNLYLSRGDTTNAIANYIIANEKSTRGGIDKAINQLTLGEIYFARRNYELAQPCYSEAVPQLPESYPNYKQIKKRSDVLDELAVYSGNVNLQDSLLRLAAMTPEERDAVIARIIEDLKKKEKEAAEAAAREEYLAEQSSQGSTLTDNTQSFVLNSDNSWYFYNSATRNAGKTEFQRRWGSRKLEDNWRRRNKATFSVDDFEEDGSNPDTETADDSGNSAGEVATDSLSADPAAAQRAADPHYPEYYLAQIPMTDQDKATSHEVIQEGLYNMGVILKDKLNDVPAARAEFNRLLHDYPDNIYRLDTYNNLYLMLMRAGLIEEAEQYRLLIVSDFPDSKYGQAMRDPNYLEHLRGADERAEALYRQTYSDYLDNRNGAVHAAYRTMMDDMPMSRIMPKFMFLDALAYVTENKPDEFNATLRELLERYPDTDITPIASEWLKGMARGRRLHAPQSNMRGMIWDLRLGNDSTATAAGDASFELNPDSKQLLVFTYPTDVVDSRQLLYEIARHNFRSFFVRDFDLETMNFGRLGLLVVHGFANMDELNRYRTIMAASEELLLPAEVRPVAISEADFQTLLSQGRSFEEYFRYREEQDYIDAQDNFLEPIQVQTLPEAEAEQAEAEAEQAEAEAEQAEAEAEQQSEPMPQPATVPEDEQQPEPSPQLEGTPQLPEQQPSASQSEDTPQSAPASTDQQMPSVSQQLEQQDVQQPKQPVAPIAMPQDSPEATQEQSPTSQEVESPASTPQQPSTPVTAPSTTPAQTPATTPFTQPTPTPQPAEPEIPVGSEGDDPLLDE